MKVLFLDIDGVLAINHKEHDQFGSSFHEAFVENLGWIVKDTDCKIVISSSWRKNGWEEMKAMWTGRNMPGELIDITPSIRLQRGMIGFYKEMTDHEIAQYRGYSIPRGCEIEYWLKEEGDFQRINWNKELQLEYLEKAKVKNYAILDDDSDFLLCQQEHFVKTSHQWNQSDAIEGYGLTKLAAMKVIKILHSNLTNLYYGEN